MTIKEDKASFRSVKEEVPKQQNTDKNLSGAKKEWLIVSSIISAAIIIAVLLVVFKPEAEKLVVKDDPPLAEYIIAHVQPVAIPVFTQGSINAKTHIKLVAEVSGRVKQMAQLKLNGGFFKKGELLLSIDDKEYRLAITKAKAQVSSAEQQLARVTTEANQARYDLKQIGRDPSSSTSYALRKPHLAEAKANLQAAKADLEIARLQLERTKVSAPFSGRVVTKQVDIGQYVTPGTLMADIYSTEMVEVRLPLTLQQTELLGLGLRENKDINKFIDVKLTAEYSSRHYQWHAKLSHTEGELDAKNRLVYAVAEIEHPYEKDLHEPEKPPLTPGMFVKAKLTGIAKPEVIVLPRAVLRYGGEVWLINEENRLERKAVEVYAKDRHFIYLKSGIKANDRVVGNAIDYPLEGMLLEPVLYTPERTQAVRKLEKNKAVQSTTMYKKNDE